jgi:hypothetical protein
MNSQGFRSRSYPANTPSAASAVVFGLVTALMLSFFLSATPAGASELVEDDEPEAWEHSWEMNFATASVWRGLNQLGQGNQHYSPGVFVPGFSSTKGGWTLGWEAAIQLGGKNRTSNTDQGADLEHDFYLEYEKTLVGDLSWVAAFTAYTYPAAKKADAGAEHASFAEPGLGLTWDKYFSPFFKIHWFHGVQSALADYDYVYFNLGGSRDVKLAQKLTLKLASEGGWKWFTGDDSVTDNAWDVQVTAGLEWSAADELTLTLQAGAAWSNFAGKTFADEATAWLVAGACVSW